MDAEQLEAAYDKGWCEGYKKSKGESFSDVRRRAHAAGLAAVARQQAEHDAQIASNYAGGPDSTAFEIVDEIRAQFENVDRPAANPITATPEDN